MTKTSQIENPPTGANAVAPTYRQLLSMRSVGYMLLQVVLIGVGVFIGLAGEQWREDRENQQIATELLRRLRAEIVANRATITDVKDYHSARLEELDAFLAADADARENISLRFSGVRPPNFQHSAWDLALATQALAYIDAELTFSLAQTYGYQTMTDELGRGVTQSMYLRPPSETDTTFLSAVQLYYQDLVAIEPGLLTAYDDLILAIDGELGR